MKYSGNFRDGWHFDAESGYREFPELVEYIIRRSK